MSFETDVQAFAAGINAEMPLRLIVFRGDLAIGPPNDSTLSLVNGAPIGTLYAEKDTVPLNTWQKQSTASSGWVLISGGFGAIKTETLILVTSGFEALEELDVTDGSGSISGASTFSGDSTVIPADYINKQSVDFYLNGVRLEKGVQVIYSAGKLTFNIPLDPQDRIKIWSEEVI